jgi:transposase
MVTDQQVRKLMKLKHKKKPLAILAAEAGMSEKTARKWLSLGKMPGECRVERHWKTREDPFSPVWPEVKGLLANNPGLEAKTIFEYLQRKQPGVFQDGQLRTLQRKVKSWRATEGPAKEVFFIQEHEPGVLSQSDFTHMNSLGITIGGSPFSHLLYHFVLTYSDWEFSSICYSESFEALSDGLQGALCELGGVPRNHQTDRLSAASQNLGKEEFTERYKALLKHYGMAGKRINPRRANENGDIEQRHHRTKRAIDQRLMLRGSRDFSDLREYQALLRTIFKELNQGRTERLSLELRHLRELPPSILPSAKPMDVKVGQGSTIRVAKNTYSVDSRLIGETVKVHLHADHLDVCYGGKTVEKIPRIRGEKKHRIEYRHIIDWLVRKPGAFANYRYREDLFPTSRFRCAYDLLREKGSQADKEYLSILYLAAYHSEELVDRSLSLLLGADEPISADIVVCLLDSMVELPKPTEIEVSPPDLSSYDALLEAGR